MGKSSAVYLGGLDYPKFSGWNFLYQDRLMSPQPHPDAQEKYTLRENGSLRLSGDYSQGPGPLVPP